jgi:oxygen-independent coproporphyrinogen-3 oxidase
MYEYASERFEANGYVQYEISNWAKEKRDEGGRRKDETILVKSSSFILDNSSFACKHNLQYWRGLPYLAFGAGAHGYANGYRYSNVLRIKTYIDRLTNPNSLPLAPHVISQANHAGVSSLPFPLTPATVNHHQQTLKDDMSEFMMTGLRLTQEGISEKEFQKRFGQSLEEVYGKEIKELSESGLIESPSPSGREARGERVRLTNRGRLLGNQVFMRFL